ncbi:T-complex protein 1 subunit epsilon [Enteropsectra breve]|nr:T-complex protein 1 subunit epsilon [Enteropsectra breve]KAI5150291.1 T-complex protein 1 subunit epsilon [Enteropsectra breve]
MSQILTDEIGQSFQYSDNAPTVKGKECILANINTVENIAGFVRTSLGPNGLDKILIDQDDNITVSNDGATILQEMHMDTNPVSRLIVQLSQSQDEEIGDGTTSIVLLAAAMLRKSKGLLDKGIHPVKIAEGFSQALALASEHLAKISEPVADLRTAMIKAAKTTLSSKIVSSANLSEMCVDAILSVADMERKDVDLDLIYIQSKPGKTIAETKLIKGIVLKKEFSHPQMAKEIKNAKIALLSCPFEPPRLKTKNSLLIKSAQEYKDLESYEKRKFQEMIEAVKNSGANVVMCQWGFDDEANSLLMQNNLPAVRWVGGHELGLMAAHVNGSIIARFEDLRSESLGTANVKEESINTEGDTIITVENTEGKKSVTILVRGSTDFAIEEAKRSIRDALCSIRNIMTNTNIVYGGGSAEISTYVFLLKAAKEMGSVSEVTVQAFAQAVLEIPMALAENSGYDPTAYVGELIEAHISSGENALGVDCMGVGERNMKKVDVFEALNSKMTQFKMATELVCMVLKINEMIRKE